MEHIIREDYLVEAMELLEMLCDLLLARFESEELVLADRTNRYRLVREEK